MRIPAREIEARTETRYTKDGKPVTVVYVPRGTKLVPGPGADHNASTAAYGDIGVYLVNEQMLALAYLCDEGSKYLDTHYPLTPPKRAFTVHVVLKASNREAAVAEVEKAGNAMQRSWDVL